ncbi:hypothetical protein JCM19047_1701 [Bacillus sp. JCM 19047]|nr:hypothetical protein JCM19047_1701 [Bacillus sp. JCM 19047]
MSLIRDEFLEFELTPRKYYEHGEDPFIVSSCEISDQDKVIFKDLSVHLLESEYKEIVRGLRKLLVGWSKEFQFESVEPLLRLTFSRMKKLIIVIVEILHVTENDIEVVREFQLRGSSDLLKLFKKVLQKELKLVEDPSSLP